MVNSKQELAGKGLPDFSRFSPGGISYPKLNKIIRQASKNLLFSAKGNADTMRGVRCLRDLLLTTIKLRNAYERKGAND